MTAELHEFVYAPPSPSAQRSDVHTELAETPALSMEDRLLVWVDVRMTRHPVGATIVAYGSLVAAVIVVALAAIYSSF